MAENENSFFFVILKGNDHQLTVGLMEGKENIVFLKSIGDNGEIAFARLSQRKAIQRMLKASLETLGEKLFLNKLMDGEINTKDLKKLYSSPFITSGTLMKAFKDLPFSKKLHKLDMKVSVVSMQ